MTKQEVKKVTKQLKGSSQRIFWVEDFDEEDWRQLFAIDLLEEYEDGKSFLRVN